MAVLEVETNTFSKSNALFLANCADIAYQPFPALAARLLGLDAVAFSHGDTQGFVGRGENFLVVAFRGSEALNASPNDWLTDFSIQQEHLDDYPGRVHVGFSHALRDV